MTPPDPPQCPQCGSQRFRPRGRRHALYPAGLVHFLGLLVAIFHQASLPLEFSCRHCGARIRQRSPGAGCAHAAFVLGLALVLAAHAVGILLLLSAALGR